MKQKSIIFSAIAVVCVVIIAVALFVVIGRDSPDEEHTPVAEAPPTIDIQVPEEPTARPIFSPATVTVEGITFADPRTVPAGQIALYNIEETHFIIADDLTDRATSGTVTAAGASAITPDYPFGRDIQNWQQLRLFTHESNAITGHRDIIIPWNVIGTLLYGPYPLEYSQQDFSAIPGYDTWGEYELIANEYFFQINRIAVETEPPEILLPLEVQFLPLGLNLDEGYIHVNTPSTYSGSLYFALTEMREQTAERTPLIPFSLIYIGENRFFHIYDIGENGEVLNQNTLWIPYYAIGTIIYGSVQTDHLNVSPGTVFTFGEDDWPNYSLSAVVEILENYSGAWPGILLHFHRQQELIDAGEVHTGDYFFIQATPGENAAMSASRYTGAFRAQQYTAHPLYLTFEVQDGHATLLSGTDEISIGSLSHNTGNISLTFDGVYANVRNLIVHRLRTPDSEDMAPLPRTPMDTAAVLNAGVWPIAAPVAGHFPASLYYYRFRPGTAQANVTGGDSVLGEPGSNDNNFAQTITWYPSVEHIFLPNTAYTATLQLSPVGNRTFEYFPLEEVPNLPALPPNTTISYEHDGYNLLIHMTFEPTGAEILPAARLMHETWEEAYGFDLGRYFRHGPNDNNRHGLSSWRDDMAFVRTSATPGVGNELVVAFEIDSSLAPDYVPDVFQRYWIRAGVAATRGRIGHGRGNTATFENAFGFYEARIQFDSIRGMWGAFWLMGFQVNYFADHPTSHGALGTEIDVVETFHSWRPAPYGPHGFNNAWHWNGYGPNHTATSRGHDYYSTGVNIYDGEFHTFAVEWTPSYYIFFLNNVEIARHRDGDVTNVGVNRISQNPNYLKFSIEAASWASGHNYDGSLMERPYGEFRVDYVNVWNGPRPNIIRYDNNGTTWENHVVRGQSYIIGEVGQAPPRDGYTFQGWNTSADGSGQTFQPGDILQTSINIEDITLYAMWE